MPETIEDFWPAEIVDAADPPPVALLKEQATLLGVKTKGLVEGVIKASTEDGTAYYSLYLKAASLGDYLYKLLYIAHPAIGVATDPFDLTAQNSFGGPPVKIGSAEGFRDWLRAELSSDQVRSAISNLLRYIREARQTSRAS